MQWPRFSLRPSLELAWSYRAGANVWRLVPTADGQILGEARNHQEKQVAYFCLDEASGTVLWRDRQFDEPWWIGIEAVAGDVAILHTYEKPDLPQHRAMIAVEIRSGRELWREADVAFWFLSGASVYGLRQGLSPRGICEIDLASGEHIRTVDEVLPELGALRKNAPEAIQTGDISLPAPYLPGGDPEADRVLGRSIPPEQNARSLESLRLNDYLLVSFFVPTAPGQRAEFANHFRVIDLKKGTTIHDEIFARSVPAPVPDTFYVRAGSVVSVKDLNVVQARRLPP